MAHETRRLAEWVAATAFEDLPGDVVDAIKIYLVDDLAGGFAGCRTAWADAVAEIAASAAVGDCSLFGRTNTTSASAATLINGVAMGGFEVDHPFSQGNCHPSVAVSPALLAIAEQEHVSGKTFLTAMALAYEALCRIGMGATRAVEDERGFHGPGTNAPFGGAIAVGRALGFSSESLANALGIAGSHGGGLLEFFVEGAMTKRMHIGRGSQMGLESALLAASGFTGPSTVLEGEHGFFHAYSPAPRPELVLNDLGQRWLLHDITIKAYPCHVSFQAVVDAIQRYRATHPFNAPDVERVVIRGTGRFFEERFGERQPTTLMGAQYSLPWSAALALTRDVADPRAWSEDDLRDEELRKLAQRIELEEGPLSGLAEGDGGAAPAADFTLRVAGAEHRFPIMDWKGAPTNRCTMNDVAAKLRLYAGPYVEPSETNRMVERVASLEREPDAAVLARSIRGAGVRA